MEASLEINNNRPRIDYIDVFRGIGIIFMIMGHVGFGDTFDFFIHAFHMPMFFFVSGLFHKSSHGPGFDFQMFFHKKVQTLILPYILFGFINYFFWVLLNGFDITPLIRLAFYNTSGLPAGALWFLTALFFTELIYVCLERYVSNKWIMWIAILFLTLVGVTIGKFVTLPYAINQALVGLFFYHVGYVINSEEKLKRLLNLSALNIVLLTIVTVFLIFKNGYINMRLESYPNVAFFLLNASLSCIVGMNLCKLVNNVLNKSIFTKWICSVGKESVVYVCMNQSVMRVLKRVLKPFVDSKILLHILILMFTLLILFAISKLIYKTRLKWMIGK